MEYHIGRRYLPLLAAGGNHREFVLLPGSAASRLTDARIRQLVTMLRVVLRLDRLLRRAARQPGTTVEDNPAVLFPCV